MTASPIIRDTTADEQFQLAVREQFPESYEFEARYVEHEMAHIGHLFATGMCPGDRTGHDQCLEGGGVRPLGKQRD